jgi:hypothetical protein
MINEICPIIKHVFSPYGEDVIQVNPARQHPPLQETVPDRIRGDDHNNEHDNQNFQPAVVTETDTAAGAVFTVTGMADPAGTGALLVGMSGTIRHYCQLLVNICMNLCFSSR